MEDVATVLQRLETWDRFARHAAHAIVKDPACFGPGVTRLAEASAEMGGWYAIIETRLLAAGLRAARDLDSTAKVAAEFRDAWDRREALGSYNKTSSKKKLRSEAEDDDTFEAILADAPVSTAADDAFYAARRCAARAAACGHAGAAAQVLAETNNLLVSVVLNDLSNRAQGAVAKAAPRSTDSFFAALGGAAAETVLSVDVAAEKLAATLKAQLASTTGVLKEKLGRDPAAAAAPVPVGDDDGAQHNNPFQSLVEAQVALNTLGRAATTLVPTLREAVDDEIRTSYASSDRRVAALRAQADDLAARGAVVDKFGRGLGAAREAYAAALTVKPLGAVLSAHLDETSRTTIPASAQPAASVDLADFDGFGGAAIGHQDLMSGDPNSAAGFASTYASPRYAVTDEEFGDRRHDELRAGVAKAADALLPRALGGLDEANAASVLATTATGLADVLEARLHPKVTDLGALVLDADLRALRHVLTKHAAATTSPASASAAVKAGFARLHALAAVLNQASDLDDASFILSKRHPPLSTQDLHDALRLKGFDFAAAAA